MSNRRGAVHPLDEHHNAVSIYGVGPLDPGWYLFAGFRGSEEPTPLAGPFQDIPEVIRDLTWRQIVSNARQYQYQRVHSESGWEIYEPNVILQGEHLYLKDRVRIDSFSKLECAGGILIGNHVHIASYCHIGIGGGRVILEDGSSFGSGARVISGSNVVGLDHGCSAIDPRAQVKRSFVHVKKNATLYAGATVLPGVTVGEGSVLAAGAVATKDIPDHQMWAGVPAVFKSHLQWQEER